MKENKLIYFLLILAWLVSLSCIILGSMIMNNCYNSLEDEGLYYDVFLTEYDYHLEDLSNMKNNENWINSIEVVVNYENDVVYVVDKRININGTKFIKENRAEIIKGFNCNFEINNDILTMDDFIYYVAGYSHQGKSFINDYAMNNIHQIEILHIGLEYGKVYTTEYENILLSYFPNSIIIRKEIKSFNIILSTTEFYVGLMFALLGVFSTLLINWMAFNRLMKIGIICELLGVPKKYVYTRELTENLFIKTIIYFIAYIIVLQIAKSLLNLTVNKNNIVLLYIAISLMDIIYYLTNLKKRRNKYDIYKEWI